MELISLLARIAKMGAVNRPVLVKTAGLAREMGVSQQSMSRWLIDTERRGLITRMEGIRGYLVRVTPKGERMLEETRKDLEEALSAGRKLEIRGKAASGVDDGKYYLGLREYSRKLESVLGFRPYPGTLNVRLGAMEDSQGKEKLCAMKGLEVPGFRKGGRTFGSLKCFPCMVNGERGAVVIPERSHYGFDVLEIISPRNLRKGLGLHEGSEVKIEVSLE
jgi:riboflavin kinase